MLDATARSIEDVVVYSARHDRASLRLVVRFAGLDKAAEQYVSLRVATPTRSWDLDVHRFAGRKDKFQVRVGISKPPRPPSEDELGECGWWGRRPTPSHAAPNGPSTSRPAPSR